MRNDIHQAVIAATQKNYEMGKVTYRRAEDAAPEVTEQGVADFHNPHKLMTTQTISGIGSITKQFTAATLLKLWDEEITRGGATNFPNGIDTAFSHLLPKLRVRFSDCSDVFDQFSRAENAENFTKITLRDLLNHTHGLGTRNDEALMQLMHDNPDRPLELSEIISSTIKPSQNQYGEHYYSNVGYDLTAMIIETIANQKFDDVVRDKVLRPNGLFNTHSQSDHIELYTAQQKDLARGFVFNPYNLEVETNFNTRSNTRAAGGFKSTVEDLTRFALLYMGAEMFESVEVKRTIRENERGAILRTIKENGTTEVGKGVRPSMSKDDKYHLAMTTNADGSIGHPGVDYDFLANLRFYPATNELKVSLSVVENLSADICNKVLKKTNPKILSTIEEFWKSKLQPEINTSGNPEIGGKLWRQIVEAELLKEENAKYLSAIEQYSTLRQEVLFIPRAELLKNHKVVTNHLIEKSQVAIDAPNLATRQEPSTNPEKTCAEKMSQVRDVNSFEKILK